MKNRKRIMTGALALVCTLAAAGCGKQAEAPKATEATTAEAEVKAETEAVSEAPETEAVVEETEEVAETEEAEIEVDGSALFEAFLEGSGTVINDTETDMHHTIGKEITLQEFIDEMNHSLLEYWGEDMAMQVISVKAGEVDCGNDGITDFVLFAEADREEPYIPLDDYFVIVEEDGALHIKGMFESYYRSYGELNKYGVFEMSGSGGATVSGIDYTRVNGDGEYEFIYGIEHNVALAEPVIDRYSLPEGSVPDDYPDQEWVTDGSDGIECDIYTFEAYPQYGEEGYDEYLKHRTFVFQKDGEDVMPSQELMDFYNSIGITVTDKGTADGMVAERLVTLEITQEELETPDVNPDNAIEWRDVE